MMVNKNDVGSLTEKRSSFSCVDWRVPDFFSEKVWKHLESPSFYLARATWHFVLFELDTDRDIIYLRLKKEKSGNRHCVVEFTLSVHDIDHEISAYSQFTYNSEAESPECYLPLTREELFADEKQHSGNGVLHVRCLAHILNINLVENWSQTSWDNDSESINQDIADLFFKEINTDVSFEVEGQNIKAHKSILTARSSVFSTIFGPSMNRIMSDIINIPDFTADAFRNFLIYLYTATVDEFSMEKALSLYPIANTYNVSKLSQMCLTMMRNKISVESFCDVFALALRYNEVALIEVAKDYFAENAKDILVTLKWQLFHKENHTTVRKLFIKSWKKKTGENTITTDPSVREICPRKTVGYLTETYGPSCIVEWKISDFFSQAPIMNEYWISPTFNFSDTLWFLRLCPNSNIEYVDRVGYFVGKDDLSPRSRLVQFTLGLKSNVGTTYESMTFSHNMVSRGFGPPDFMKRSEIFEARNKLAPDDVLTLSLVLHCLDTRKMNAMTETYLVGGAADVEILNKDIANLFTKEQNSDVIIKIGDHEFKAHKSILASRSSVFAAMFDHDMQECRDGIVNIGDCNAHVFRIFLQYLYTAKSDEFTTEKVVYLYRIADKYNVKELIRTCVKFLKNNFSADTFCDVLHLALEYNEEALINAANTFFAENAEDILNSLKWQLFHEENYTVANELFIKCLNKFTK